MRIIKAKSNYYKALLIFDMDKVVLDFCRDLKERYGHKHFNFCYAKKDSREYKGWGLNHWAIVKEILSYYPDTKIEDDLSFLKSNSLQALPKKWKGTPIKIKPLFPFQQECLGFMKEKNGRCIVAMDKGMGKTITSIKYAEMIGAKTLLFCTASKKQDWYDEAKKFSSLNPEIITGKTIDNINTSDNNFFIVSYGIARDVSEMKLSVDLLLLDESHHIRNESKRSEAIIRLSNVPQIILLTATYIINRPMDAYNQLKLLYPKRFGSRFDYGHRYCDGKNEGYGWDFSGSSNEDELQSILSRITFRKKQSDIKDFIKGKKQFVVYLNLPRKDLKEYNEYYTKLLEAIKIKGVKSKMSITGILRQITSRAKVDYVKQIVAKTEGKIIIFSQFLNPLYRLKHFYKDKAVMIEGKMNTAQRTEATKEFQENPDVKIFLGSTMATQEGLNLTKAGTVIFVNLPWSPVLIDQAEDRANRYGNSNIVNSYYIITINTVDEQIFTLIRHKVRKIRNITKEKDIISLGNQSVFNEFINNLKQL